MNSLKIVRIIGIVLTVAGLIVGVFPLSVKGVECGSAWIGSENAWKQDLRDTFTNSYSSSNSFEGRCESLRTSVSLVAVVLLVAGLIILIWALYSISRAKNGNVDTPEEVQMHQSTFNVSSELEKLSSLKEAGVLTEDEFDAAKQRVLGSSTSSESE